MSNLISNIEFWKVMASLAWPLVVLVIFLSLRRHFLKLFERDEMTLEIWGTRISVGSAAKQVSDQVSDLLTRVAAIEGGKDGKPAASQTPSIERSKFSILWVDDFPSNNAFLVDKLRHDGFEVELATSTQEAIDTLNQRKFDLLISDLGRIESGVDNPLAGLDLLKRMAAMERRPPSLIYAGRRGLDNERSLKNAGADLVTNSPTEVITFVEHHRKKLHH